MEQAGADEETRAAERPSDRSSAAVPGAQGRCRFCGSALSHTFIDLGMSPLCESYLGQEQLNQVEPFYPLHVWVCDQCLLVQLEEYVSPQAIFSEYAYFSSYSLAWLGHARAYADAMIERLGLTADSLVVELGSNDGYLLQYFGQQAIPVLGIEPAGNVAAAARTRGVPTRTAFFTEAVARELVAEGQSADLIVINNVLAQVPDLGSFVRGVRGLLKPRGVVTIEAPHLMRLIEGVQFDTIYHEHFSYFSFLALEAILAAHGLVIFGVEELWTHGGSLRIYAGHAGAAHPQRAAVDALRARERAAGYDRIEGYAGFEPRVRELKWRLLECLIGLRRAGKTIAGYGAPGKGNTLLNYCGIRTDLLAFTVDRNPYKQGKFLPGTHIPIRAPELLEQAKPDYILILPWNLRDEIVEQLAFARAWGARFIVPIPEVTLC
jgi:SAM-dependent methyltransferase